jgi:hypothetical protein
MRNRRQGVPAGVLDNERGLSYVKSSKLIYYFNFSGTYLANVDF